MELQEAIDVVAGAAESDWDERFRAAISALVNYADRSLDRVVGAPEPDRHSNLRDAIEIVAEIDRVRGVCSELKSAFARRELDGGVKASYMHPLYVQAQERLAELHDQLIVLI